MIINHIKLQRGLGILTAMLATFLFVPAAFAANSIVSNIAISPDPFHTQIPGHVDAAKVFITYDWNAGGYTTGDVTEVIKNGNGDVVYYWGATIGADARTTVAANTDHISLDWNGKANTGAMNGQYVADGTYTFYVLSHVASPPDTEGSKTFQVVKTVAPAVAWISAPDSLYYLNSGDYTVNYSLLKNSASTVIVDLTIHGPTGGSAQDRVLSANLSADGNYSFAWDGKINGTKAAPGQYTYTLVPNGSVDGFGTLGNSLTGSFTVANGNAPSPSISNLSATPNPFNPSSGSMTLGYTLGGSSGNTTIVATIYTPNDMVNSTKSWALSNQSNGNNTISWDGKNTGGNLVSDGSYIFRVSGSDGNFTLVPVQTSFTISTAVIPPPSNQCAGFSDLSKNDSDCAAFQYVKDSGAMTGNPDGTFAPEASLQRDQVAKIALETFKKYNSGTDYCHSANPFPDVTANSWAFQYICRGVALSMITGYQGGVDAGFYRPARAVNRVEFLALLLRNLSDTMPANNLSSYADVALNQWFTGYARYSKDNNLFIGGNLYPTSSTTRREVAEVIYKLHQAGKIN